MLELVITTAFWRFSDPCLLEMMHSVSSSLETCEEEFIFTNSSERDTFMLFIITAQIEPI